MKIFYTPDMGKTFRNIIGEIHKIVLAIYVEKFAKTFRIILPKSCKILSAFYFEKLHEIIFLEKNIN